MHILLSDLCAFVSQDKWRIDPLYNFCGGKYNHVLVGQPIAAKEALRNNYLP